MLCLVIHSGLYPARFGKTLQAFRQESHKQIYVSKFSQGNMREETSYCTPAESQGRNASRWVQSFVREDQKRDRMQVVRGRGNEGCLPGF